MYNWTADSAFRLGSEQIQSRVRMISGDALTLARQLLCVERTHASNGPRDVFAATHHVRERWCPALNAMMWS